MSLSSVCLLPYCYYNIKPIPLNSKSQQHHRNFSYVDVVHITFMFHVSFYWRYIQTLQTLCNLVFMILQTMYAFHYDIKLVALVVFFDLTKQRHMVNVTFTKRCFHSRKYDQLQFVSSFRSLNFKKQKVNDTVKSKNFVKFDVEVYRRDVVWVFVEYQYLFARDEIHYCDHQISHRG